MNYEIILAILVSLVGAASIITLWHSKWFYKNWQAQTLQFITSLLAIILFVMYILKSPTP